MKDSKKRGHGGRKRGQSAARLSGTFPLISEPRRLAAAIQLRPDQYVLELFRNISEQTQVPQTEVYRHALRQWSDAYIAARDGAGDGQVHPTMPAQAVAADPTPLPAGAPNGRHKQPVPA